MKDEEKRIFEKWFEEKKEKCEVYGNGADFWVDDEIKKFCLMGYEQGLKVGRPQWHDLRKNPNDLPERDKTFVTDVSVTVTVYPLGFAMYYFFDKKWYSNGKEVKVDMWCEIPTFDKE